MTSEINWDALRQAASVARDNAYAVYSNYPVGAAALTASGRVVTGCNVENASYGLTLCAECSLVSDLYRTSNSHPVVHDKLVAVVVVDRLNMPLSPCGRCRQLLLEHGEPGCLIQTADGLKTIEQLLPNAFSPRDLENTGE